MLQNSQNSDSDDNVVIPKLDLEDGKIYDPTARVRAIRDLIVSNPGKVLTIDHFNKATRTRSASRYLKPLRVQGMVRRHRIVTANATGAQFTYEWIGPNAPLQLTIDELGQLAQQWKEQNSAGEDENVLAFKQLGVTQFITYLKKIESDKKAAEELKLPPLEEEDKQNSWGSPSM